MKIGLDLDNTLIDYDLSFIAAAETLKLKLLPSIISRIQIRDFLRATENGEIVWQRLQGLAYGRFAKDNARLYAGVKRFLWRCKQLGHSVTVVSHKTEFGHFDNNNSPLREIALQFLSSQNLLDTNSELIKRVVFTNTREEKIKCIANESFDWFVDDLPEVIHVLEKFAKLKVIHFDPSLCFNNSSFRLEGLPISLSNWQQIDALINGDWSVGEICEITNKLTLLKPIEVKKLSKGGNANVFRVLLEDYSQVRIKIYPVDAKHDRLISEFNSCNALSKLNMTWTAQPIAKEEELGFGIYSWIIGEPVELPEKKDIETSLEFLSQLHSNRNSPKFSDIGLASDACLCGRDIEKQIERRLKQFELPRMCDSQLDHFLSSSFLPLSRKIIDKAKKKWPNPLCFDIAIDRSKQTLSPSDFGFHNSIRRTDGSIAFVDFEYFGWDDPVKLMSDFVYHPGMNLSDEMKLSWIDGALNIYGSTLANSFFVSAPLYGLIWCLITLNDFRPDIWIRRSQADLSKQDDKQVILAEKIERASNLLRDISNSCKSYLSEIRYL